MKLSLPKTKMLFVGFPAPFNVNFKKKKKNFNLTPCMTKLRVEGSGAVFSLQITISILF
jgi:hypothetical protein